eukprot:gene2490-5420_t
MTESDTKRAKVVDNIELSEYDKLDAAVDYVKEQCKTPPLIGIICGSGLGGLADQVNNPTVINYSTIPHFPVSTVAGHDGKLILGEIGGAQVIVMKGRLHFYEGYNLRRIALPIRTMCKLGIKVLLVTNAAGGLNEKFNVGDLMILEDHLNFPGFAGQHPLVGPHDERYGHRFVSMSKPYDKNLRGFVSAVCKDLGLESVMHSGVYAMLSGPTYESPAEARFVKSCGADAVGMSTVPEVVVAIQAGVKCMAMSLITNKVVMTVDDDNEPNHEEVLAAANARQKDVQNLFVALCSKIKDNVETL